jgi:hypothetical protein
MDNNIRLLKPKPIYMSYVISDTFKIQDVTPNFVLTKSQHWNSFEVERRRNAYKDVGSRGM